MIELVAYLCPPNLEELKFILYITRHFGLHPELSGEVILFPEIEHKEAEKLIQSIQSYEPKTLSSDLTTAVNTFIMGL